MENDISSGVCSTLTQQSSSTFSISLKYILLVVSLFLWLATRASSRLNTCGQSSIRSVIQQTFLLYGGLDQFKYIHMLIVPSGHAVIIAGNKILSIVSNVLDRACYIVPMLENVLFSL